MNIYIYILTNHVFQTKCDASITSAFTFEKIICNYECELLKMGNSNLSKKSELSTEACIVRVASGTEDFRPGLKSDHLWVIKLIKI